MNLHIPTPTQAAADKRRKKFHADIAARAASLGVERQPETISPEAMPAETDPPRAGSFAELLAWRQEALKTLEQVDEQIGRIERASAYPPVYAIQEAVAKRYRITRNDICSARRTANIVAPRQIAYFLAKELTPFSLVAIGRFFGGRDHTSVLSGVRKITRLCATNPEVAAEVQALTEIITGSK